MTAKERSANAGIDHIAVTCVVEELPHKPRTRTLGLRFRRMQRALSVSDSGAPR